MSTPSSGICQEKTKKNILRRKLSFTFVNPAASCVKYLSMISVRQLTKRYGGTLALDGINFEIQPGEIVGLLGPNGAGKTTTLKILSCFLPPTSGTVTLAGLDIREQSLQVRRQIGHLPENNPLYEDMEASEYLEWIAELRGLPKDRRVRRVRELVERCSLQEAIGKDIGQLSRGYRQRVGLAQAILQDPPILLLDEPTSGLDPNQAREVRQLIRELKKQKTVILSTHILPEVQATCDRVIIIHKGKIAASGTPQQLQAGSSRPPQIQLVLKSGPNPKEAEEVLKKLSGVENLRGPVTSDGEIRFDLSCRLCDADVREEVFRLAVEKRWVILELRREQTSLEEIFRQLTV